MRLPALLAAFILCAIIAPARADEPVVIDPSINNGKWEGWGISLAWWAKVFGDREDVADVLFTSGMVDFGGEKLPGLGLTIARYNAGACGWNEIDGRKMVVSKTIAPFRQIEGFWLDGKNPDPNSASWNWSVDANQRAMLRMAKERGANRFELFSNAPLWWMCANANPSGRANNKEDNLPRENYQKFAIYLATIAAKAKSAWGITFTTVEPFNEPISGWWTENCKQEGCYFSSASQAAFLPVLRAELNRRRLLDMPIAASDETSYADALKTWTSFTPQTKGLVSQVNVHGYQGANGPRAELYELAATRDRKRLWNSEYGDEFGDGLRMAQCINLDISRMHNSAWCYWQAFDGGNRGGWGLFGADLDRKTISHANPKYFALAQYSRHIRPGMTLLSSSDPNTAAAYNPTSRKLAWVTFNDGPARTVTFDLSRFFALRGPVARWLTEPLATSRYVSLAPLILSGKSLTAELPAHSIQSFELDAIASH